MAAVRVGAVQRWSKVVFKRSVRDVRRGTSLKLHVAKVAVYLVEHSHWVKPLRFTAKALGRLVDSGIKFSKKAQIIKAVPGTESAARVAAQSAER